MIFSNSILRAYGSSLLGIVSGLITNLWLLREIARHVSATDLGLYALILQISSYLSILQLGLDFAASRQIAEFLGRKDFEAASRTYYEMRRINALTAAVVGVAVLLLSLALSQNIGISHGGSSTLAWKIALLAGTAQVINFLTLPRMAALIGDQQMPTVNLLVAVRTIVTSLLAYPLLVEGFGVLSVPISEVVCQGSAFVMLIKLCRTRCSGWLTPTGTGRDRKLLRSIFNFGSLTVLGGMGWTVEATSDVLILSGFAGPTVVAVYVLWWRFPQMTFDLCSRLAFSAFPQFAQRHGESTDASRMLFAKVFVLTLGLATMAMVGISWWLANFIHLWIGASYAVANPRLLAYGMGLLVCLRTCGNLLGLFWVARGTPGMTTALSWAQAALKVGSALVLVHPYGLLGLIGASCLAAALQVTVIGSYLFREGILNAVQIQHSGTLLLGAFLVSSAVWYIPHEKGLVYFVLGATTTILLWGMVWLMFARKPSCVLTWSLLPTISAVELAPRCECFEN